MKILSLVRVLLFIVCVTGLQLSLARIISVWGPHSPTMVAYQLACTLLQIFQMETEWNQNWKKWLKTWNWTEFLDSPSPILRIYDVNSIRKVKFTIGIPIFDFMTQKMIINTRYWDHIMWKSCPIPGLKLLFPCSTSFAFFLRCL